MEVVIITGMSGAGKTKAADWFEDKGYYCVDNMPPTLIKNFIELAITGNRKISKAAFVVDIRGGQFFGEFKETLVELALDANVDFKMVFIEASNESLIRRFNEARRSHPLSDTLTVKEAIQEERVLLSELRNRSNFVIDTSNLKVAELNSELEKIFSSKTKKDSFVLKFMSFGYKHGIPIEADWVIDVRFIPNPYYVSSLRRLTGNNKKVAQYVLKQDITKDFIVRMQEVITKLIPAYVKEGKYSLTIAFGCTGGQHRSVTLANAFYEIFDTEGWRVTLEHREL
jgi:UPF0042 nucleotide-binding protein